MRNRSHRCRDGSGARACAAVAATGRRARRSRTKTTPGLNSPRRRRDPGTFVATTARLMPKTYALVARTANPELVDVLPRTRATRSPGSRRWAGLHGERWLPSRAVRWGDAEAPLMSAIARARDPKARREAYEAETASCPASPYDRSRFDGDAGAPRSRLRRLRRCRLRVCRPRLGRPLLRRGCARGELSTNHPNARRDDRIALDARRGRISTRCSITRTAGLAATRQGYSIPGRRAPTVPSCLTRAR